MSVRFFYIDESFDERFFCLSAIGIRHVDWKDCFSRVRQHRSFLKEQYGIFLRKEIHAHEFVAGRGRIAPVPIGKYDRSRIYEGLLGLVSALPNVILINVCLEQKGRKNAQLDAWDRMVNRIERLMVKLEEHEVPLRRDLLEKASSGLSGSDHERLEARLMAYSPSAVLIADEGREAQITRALRKMNVYNPIPSMRGWWGDAETRNIPITKFIEDPVFKRSAQSYFVQLADCVAFSLLKRESEPTRLVKRYELDRMFDRRLPSICLKKASRKDPLGIVRR
jgi:hypothetical protein